MKYGWAFVLKAQSGWRVAQTHTHIVFMAGTTWAMFDGYMWVHAVTGNIVARRTHVTLHQTLHNRARVIGQTPPHTHTHMVSAGRACVRAFTAKWAQSHSRRPHARTTCTILRIHNYAFSLSEYTNIKTVCASVLCSRTPPAAPSNMLSRSCIHCSCMVLPMLIGEQNAVLGNMSPLSCATCVRTHSHLSDRLLF